MPGFATVNVVNVPTLVIFGCAAVVTVPAVVALPAVVAAPVNEPTNVVLVTLVSPATVVTVEPKVNAVLPNVTLALASLTCANVPEETLLAFNAVNELPLPEKTPFAATLPSTCNVAPSHDAVYPIAAPARIPINSILDPLFAEVIMSVVVI